MADKEKDRAKEGSKKNIPSMSEENIGFIEAAYRNNPKARASIDKMLQQKKK